MTITASISEARVISRQSAVDCSQPHREAPLEAAFSLTSAIRCKIIVGALGHSRGSMLRRAKLCVLAIYPAPTIPNLSSLSIVRLNASEGDQNGSFVKGANWTNNKPNTWRHFLQSYAITTGKGLQGFF